MSQYRCFFFNDTATTEIYTYRHTLSLHDALPICRWPLCGDQRLGVRLLRGKSEIAIEFIGAFTAEITGQHFGAKRQRSLDIVLLRRVEKLQTRDRQRRLLIGIEHLARFDRSEEHTSELQSLMRISYAVFCLKKK